MRSSREGIDTMLAGDVDSGKAILRDTIKATVGFEKLERAAICWKRRRRRYPRPPCGGGPGWGVSRTGQRRYGGLKH